MIKYIKLGSLGFSMSRNNLILLAFAIAGCITVGLVIMKPWQKDQQIVYPQPPSDTIVADGGQIAVSIIALRQNGTPVPGVQVILADEVQGTSIVGTTNDQGKTDISLISGHLYNFIAEFGSFNKAIEHTFNQSAIAEILISDDGTVGSILLK
jgi:hypothetical protein